MRKTHTWDKVYVILTDALLKQVKHNEDEYSSHVTQGLNIEQEPNLTFRVLKVNHSETS